MKTKQRILIVEDETLVSEDVAEILTNSGYETFTARSATAAIEIATDKRPHLVLMDIVLEGEMDGIEAAGIIGSELEVPILFLSAYGDREMLQRARITQPFGYLVKPFSEGELIAAIEIALSKFDRERQLKAEDARLRSINEELEKRVRERTVHLLKLNQEMEREIAERKRAERALRASVEKHRLLIDTAPVGILSVDTEGRILEVNQKLLEIMGSPSADATKSINMLSFDPLVEAGVSGVFQRCMENATVHSAEIPYTSKWGKASYLRMLLNPIFGERGVVTGCQAVVEDVTERKRAEEALEESRRMLEGILAAVPVGITLHRDGLIQWANEAFARMFGFQTREDCVGQLTRMLYETDEDHDAARTSLYAGLEGVTVTEIDTKLRRQNGELYDGIVRVTSLDASDPTKGVIAAITDVSERKSGEKALRESEERYRATFNNAAVGINLVGPEGRFIEANETLASFLGYRHEELSNLTIFDVTHPQDSARCREKWESVLGGEVDSFRLEKRYERKDGTVVWGDTSVSAIRGQDGECRAAVGVIADITNRKKSEDVRLRLATAVEQAAEAIVIADTEGNIVYVNPAFERITGFSREDAIGANPRIVRSGRHDEAFYRRMWETISSGKVWSGHLINRKKDGTLFEEEATISPIKNSADKIVNYVAVKRDVTREVSLQTQLLQAQKMEAVGTLAGGIAHDFNNLLTVISGFTELLLADKTDEDPEHADLQTILSASTNGAELVKQLLTFSRKAEPKSVPMNLHKQVMQIEPLLRRTLPKMIDIEVALDAGTTDVIADAAQMEQLLMNLAVNARDAMPDGGKLHIKTTNVELDEEDSRLHLGVKPGVYVLLTVADTGHGMDKETLEHIFEPFFTTKELGRGTGLGLSMVYGIVNQHNGCITCVSEVGRGTTFEIYLPVMLKHEEPDVQDAEDMPISGTETVLLVDDEEFVRELGARILGEAGYTVIRAANGIEAEGIFRKEKGKISLVILDLIMPEMGGKECLDRLLKLDPEVKVLITSGYFGDASARECIESGAGGFVNKPFRARDFLQRVRKLLDEA